MRSLIIGLLCGCMLWGPLLVAAEATACCAEPTVAPDDGPSRMSRRERRKLGLTFGNILRVAREMRKAGTLDEDDEIAQYQVLTAIALENPQEWSKVGEFDWQGFADFLERIWPLVLQLIEMWMKFGDATLAVPWEVAAVAPTLFVLAT